MKLNDQSIQISLFKVSCNTYYVVFFVYYTLQRNTRHETINEILAGN